MRPTEFEKKVKRFSALRRPMIAFGLAKPEAEVLQSVKRGLKHAKIILVGPPAIQNVRGFPKVIDAEPERRLATLLAKEEVEGIVRGTLDYFKTLHAYEKIAKERHTINPSLLETPTGRQFFVGPLSNAEGWTRRARLREAKGTANFVVDWGIKPKIAVYTDVRHETYSRRKRKTGKVQKNLNETYKDAEWIVGRLRRARLLAKNWAVDFNVAVKEGYNIHISVNGMVGNQIIRAILASGGRLLAAPMLGLSRPFEDSSRTETDMEFHFRWIAALINRKKLEN